MRKSVLTLIALSGLSGCCFGLFGGGNYRKVNIYPNDATWAQLSAGGTKLGWTMQRGPNNGWALTGIPGNNQKIEMMSDENICAVAADQRYATGCAGLSFRCEDGFDKDQCTARFVSLAQASGIDPATLKFSNRMANTEGSGKPFKQ